MPRERLFKLTAGYLLGKEEQPSGDGKELMVVRRLKQIMESQIMEIDTSQLSSPDRRAIWDGEALQQVLLAWFNALLHANAP